MSRSDAAARLAIDDLVARYCDAARGDAAAFASCWAPDARWTGPGLDRSGRDAIVRTFVKMRSRFAVALQAVVSGTVRVAGPTATGAWWIRELQVTDDGDVRELVGRYDDEYGHGAAGWQITCRAFTPATRPGA